MIINNSLVGKCIAAATNYSMSYLYYAGIAMLNKVDSKHAAGN